MWEVERSGTVKCMQIYVEFVGLKLMVGGVWKTSEISENFRDHQKPSEIFTDFPAYQLTSRSLCSIFYQFYPSPTTLHLLSLKPPTLSLIFSTLKLPRINPRKAFQAHQQSSKSNLPQHQFYERLEYVTKFARKVQQFLQHDFYIVHCYTISFRGIVQNKCQV
jgi:hypothetical protein